MPFPLRATEAVKKTLRQLRDGDDTSELWTAIQKRVALIRTEPASPLARGVERQMQPSGILARASMIYVDGDAWALVWYVDDDAIHLVHLERLAE
jgi:hypothetical protein